MYEGDISLDPLVVPIELILIADLIQLSAPLGS
jgi:hypothetical protein